MTEYRNSTLRIRKSRLEGTVSIDGAKNSALRLLVASLLTSERISLRNFPTQLLDAQVQLDMLSALGKTSLQLSRDHVEITENGPVESKLQWNDRSIRNTLLMLGALTARFGEAAVPLPGGCRLGDRKHDLHIDLLETLGARVWEENEQICAEAPKGLKGTDIHLRIRSTGATENAILCGSLASGSTRIWNPHIRPEILDLVALLRKMGAKIEVFGQERIEIEGVEELHGAEHKVIPDNMEAITWLVGAGITEGDVEIFGFPYQDLEVVVAHLKAAGVGLYTSDNSVIVRGARTYPLEISTGPHPGINSDVQPILAAWAAKARGESRIIDLRFPGRYAYAEELARLGVSHRVEGDLLMIFGDGGKLNGATVRALDLRAGAALALAGLIADGETEIADAWQISRGYVEFSSKLKQLGADVDDEHFVG